MSKFIPTSYSDFRQAAIDARRRAIALQQDEKGRRLPHSEIKWWLVNEFVWLAGEHDRNALARRAIAKATAA